jgi:hypothetical protein
MKMEMKDLFPGDHHSNGRSRWVAFYDYKDEAGAFKYQVVRTDPKGFFQRRPCCPNPRNEVKDDWILGRGGVKPFLYRLPQLRAAPPNELVIVVEGEKDADRVSGLGLVATTSPMGASKNGQKPKWKPWFNEPLCDRHVILIPDNDDAGRAHMEAARQSLQGIAASVTILELPGLPPGGDVSDWIDQGGTKEQLLEMAAKAMEDQRKQPPPSSRRRARRARRARTPEKQGESTAESLAHLAHLADKEPWTGDLGELLNRVEVFLRRFIIYPSDHARIAHTLWIAHTHAMDCWESTGRIAFLSPEPASGKTRALEITELLVPRPVESVNASTAYLFRKVADPAGLPTILYDEIDTLFGPKAKENEDIRGLLNAGHRRGATAGRCEIYGKTVICVEYPAYCAVALAGLGFLPDTLMSRSIVIRMRRRAPGEKVEAFRHRDHASAGHSLRDELARWARWARNAGMAKHRPAMPAGVADRAADVWESLLTIADYAKGDWPQRARLALLAHLALVQEDGGGSLGVRLLTDLKAIFGAAEGMHTEEILRQLNALVESPWGDLKGKPLDSRRLARFLNPYGVQSADVWIAEITRKGYRRQDLHDAWQRYVPEKPKKQERDPGQDG